MKNLNVQRDSLYFESRGESLFGILHTKGNQHFNLGVVICSPIGRENNHTHRTIRHLADHLADHHIPTLRFDYYSIGNSNGDEFFPNLADSWQSDIVAAINLLKEKCGVKKVILIGVRLGALLALKVSEVLSLNEIVLWYPVLNGRSFTRELIITSKTSENTQNQSIDFIEAAGFILTRPNEEKIKELHYKKMELANLRNVLIINQDKNHDIENVISDVSGRGEVEFVVGGEYHEMFAMPHLNSVAFDEIEKIVSWCEKLKEEKSNSFQLNSFIKTRVQHVVRDSYQETISQKDRLFFISLIAEKKNNNPIILILNTGMDHNVGTNRLSVTLSIKFAEMGFDTVRMDLSGVGESITDNLADENEMFSPKYQQDVVTMVNYLSKTYGKKIILMGVCAGGQTSYLSAIDHPELPVVDYIIINTILYRWKDKSFLNYLSRSDNNRYLNQAVSDVSRWKKLLSGEVKLNSIKKLLKIFINRFFPEQNFRDIEVDFNKFLKNKRPLTLIYSDDELGIDVLNKEGRSFISKMKKRKDFQLMYINRADHVFSTYDSRIRLGKMLQDHLKNKFL